MKTSPFNSFSLFRKKKPKPPTAALKKEGSLSQKKGTEPFDQNLVKEKDLPTGTSSQKKPSQLPQPTTPLFDNQTYSGTRPLREEAREQQTGPIQTPVPPNNPPPPKIKQKKPKKRGGFWKALLWGLFLAVLLGGVLALGYAAIRFLQQPLAPQLAITTIPSMDIPTSLPSPEPLLPSVTPEISPSPTPAGFCGLSGRLSVLFIADDMNYWEYPYGADAIRMIGIDFDEASVAIFAFPRDLWLTTSPLNKYNIQEYKLGSSYGFIQQREGMNQQSSILSTNAVAQIIYDNFNIAPDYYLVIHQSMMKNLIDTLGGLEVSISQSVNDPQLGLYLNPGYQKLDGLTVEKYMRYLNGHSTLDEWGRFSRQNEILRGFQQNLSKPEIFSQIPQLVNQFSNLITTDLSITQLLDLACAANTITTEKIEFFQMDRNSIQIYPDGTMYLLNKQAVVDQLNTIFTK